MDLEVDSWATRRRWNGKIGPSAVEHGLSEGSRRSVLSESTNRHNNAADDAEADSDGDLCHKTDPERGETWFARGATARAGGTRAGAATSPPASPPGAGARDDDGDVVFDYADAAASSSTSASTARHPVLAAISAKACDVAVLVMCPEMLAEHAAWFVLAARAGIISLVVIDECDEEVGNDDSFRRSQEAQGRTIQACFALAGAKAPVVALSGTLSKFERPVGTAFQLELARDSCEPPPTARRARAGPGPTRTWPRRWAWRKRGRRALVAASAAISTRRLPPRPRRDEADRRRCGALEILLRRQKSALVAERDGAAAELAHLCQEKVRS
ncbi:hypothetical protein JL720_3874 [Aureococcus anophagefferens]|nr:hypothetical protein JL720_3874 [Aureococcus anophagefferens]